MSTTGIVVRGWVRPDGTLELDEKLQWPAGRVEVTVRPAAAPPPPQEDWWQFLQRARAELEARGTGFRTQEEIEAERESFRAGDERLEEVYRELERERRRAEQKGC